MKLATWNVNSLTVRLPQVLDWLAQHQPDVLCIQECKLTDDKFPAQALQTAGYNAQWFGQKTYNGVALITRNTLDHGNDLAPSLVVHNIPGFQDMQARVISACVAGIRVVGAYFPNGQAPESEKFVYKMQWLAALHQWLEQELLQYPKLVLMGDYNIAPHDADVHDPALWANQIHCTAQEREHFQALLSLGLVDAFRLFDQPAKSWSWWDYRQLAFRKNQGLRIDHILVSTALKNQVLQCHIDKEPRKNERPSDHAPVWLELN
jgi:exodeoxyribonuclease III